MLFRAFMLTLNKARLWFLLQKTAFHWFPIVSFFMS